MQKDGTLRKEVTVANEDKLVVPDEIPEVQPLDEKTAKTFEAIDANFSKSEDNVANLFGDFEPTAEDEVMFDYPDSRTTIDISGHPTLGPIAEALGRTIPTMDEIERDIDALQGQDVSEAFGASAKVKAKKKPPLGADVKTMCHR